MDALISRTETAQQLDVSTAMVRKLEARGKLSPIKRGERTYYDRQQVDELEFARSEEKRRRATERSLKEVDAESRSSKREGWDADATHRLLMNRQTREDDREVSLELQREQLREQTESRLQTKRLTDAIDGFTRELRKPVATGSPLDYLLPLVTAGAFMYFVGKPQERQASTEQTTTKSPPSEKDVQDMLDHFRRWKERQP